MLSVLRKKFPAMLDVFAPLVEAMTEVETMQNAVALLALAETPEDVRRILQTGE
jgi:hypothetical protein